MFLGILGLLGLIVFGIMSIVALIKKNGKAMRNFIVAGVCFLLFIVGVVSSSESDKADSKADDDKVEVTAADNKDEEKRDNKKDDNRNIAEKLEDDDRNVDKATLDDDTLNIESEVTSMWDETSILKTNVYNMFESLDTGFKDKDVNKVEVTLTTEMIDEKGNGEVKPVVEYEYSRESFEELNYDKFLEMSVSQTWRILNESDAYLIHPGIYKNVKDDFKKELKHNGMKIKD